jgi:hypothetical protein
MVHEAWLDFILNLQEGAYGVAKGKQGSVTLLLTPNQLYQKLFVKQQQFTVSRYQYKILYIFSSLYYYNYYDYNLNTSTPPYVFMALCLIC